MPALRGAKVLGTAGRGGRIFYVGEGSEALARTIASKTGYKTIFNTWYGALANRISPFLSKSRSRAMWTLLSKVFAHGVRKGDEVITVFGRHHKTGLHSLPIKTKAVWKTTEYPILNSKGIIDFRTILTE